MRGRRIVAVLGAALVVALPMVAGGSASGSPAPIMIGATYEKTGPVPSLGAEGPGALAAAKYINAHGGILGRQVKIVLEDNAGDPAQAISQLRQFASQGINVVLGGAFGVDCTAEAPIAATLKEVVFCGSTDNLPPNHSNMFGIGPDYTVTIKGTIALIKRYAKKAAVFADLSADGGDSVSIGSANMRAVGVTPVGERYPVNATTFTPEIQDAISKGAQLLWFTACSPGAITSVAEAESLGFKGKIVLENCLASSGVAQALKGLAGNEQVLVQSPYSLLSTPAPDPAERAAIALYKSQVPGPVDTVETAGWDSMMVAAKAIQKAHSTSTPALLSALAHHLSYTGVWQSGTFTAQNHQPGILAGYAVPTYFTKAGTIALLK